MTFFQAKKSAENFELLTLLYDEENFEDRLIEIIFDFLVKILGKYSHSSAHSKTCYVTRTHYHGLECPSAGLNLPENVCDNIIAIFS